MKKSKSILFVLTILALTVAACSTPVTQVPASTEIPATEVAATEIPGSEVQLCAAESMGGENASALAIGTGGQGGVFYPYGEGLANTLSANMSGVTATFVETGGSVDNIKQVQSGELQLGFSTVDSAYDAILGQAAYADSGKAKVCALAVLYTSLVHVVASEASGITSMEEMKGRTVSFGDSGSSTEGAADRLFEAAGLDPKADVTRQNLSIADAANAMAAGTLDAFFWIGGTPTKAVADMLAGGTKVTFIDASEYLDALTSKYGPVYSSILVPKDAYGTETDISGIGVGNILFVDQTMSEDQAYQIVKTIFEQLDEVHALHPQASSLQLQTAVTGSSIPFHPGAIKFYTEQNVWK
jgi:TRAP transporter TAXI family solute receptor